MSETSQGDSTAKKMQRKPARCQLDPSLVSASNKPEQTGQVFNIWYSKWTGGENNGRRGLTHAEHRCDVKRDSGYTRADKYAKENQVNRSKYFCLYFARGYCCNGKNCDYLHRIPTELDVFSPTVDCFGRERFMDYRDDMSGIGSFGRVNKTLYVGGIVNMTGNIEMRISKAFGEFGDINYINVVPSKHIAFVSYKLESQAQFAKEAMYGQSLEPGNETETLNIRWANEDPSFTARKRQREDENEMTMEMARKLLHHFKEENNNKSQKISVKEDIYESNDEETLDKTKDSTQKVELDYASLNLLAQLRSKQDPGKVGTEGLVSGYSTSDED